VHAVPVYTDQHGNPGTWLDLQYWLFYAFNGTESFVIDGEEQYTQAVPWSFHEGDFECVTVRINTSQQIVGACFSQHSGGQWNWSPGEGFQVLGTQVISYVACGSHANYTQPGGPYWIGSTTVDEVRVGLADWAVWDEENGSQEIDYGEDNRTVIVADGTGWFGASPAAPSWMGFEGHWGMPAQVTLDTGDLANVITACIDALAPAWLARVLTMADVPAELAALIGLFADISQEGPANLPQQGGWRGQPQIEAAAYDGNSWNSFPLPQMVASTSLSCVTEQVNGLTDIHGIYRDADGYPCYARYDAGAGTWTTPARVGAMQCDTAPAIAAFNGTLYCVFANNAVLYCSIFSAASGWQPPSSMKNNGIAYNTSPALFVEGGVLYCVYQFYGHGGGAGDGELFCMTLQQASGASWTQQNPQSGNYYGMSCSPSAVTVGNGTIVLYQGYNLPGYLSASLLDPAGWHQLILKAAPAAGWPAAYMSSSPGAAFWKRAIYVALNAPAPSRAFNVTALLPSPDRLVSFTPPVDAVIPSGTPPTLLGYGDSLLCFWVGRPE